jgi:hypothetical protein
MGLLGSIYSQLYWLCHGLSLLPPKKSIHQRRRQKSTSRSRRFRLGWVFFMDSRPTPVLTRNFIWWQSDALVRYILHLLSGPKSLTLYLTRKSAGPIAMIILGGLLLVILGFYDAYWPQVFPLFPPVVFRNVRGVTVVLIGTFLFGMMYYSTAVLWPQQSQALIPQN